MEEKMVTLHAEIPCKSGLVEFEIPEKELTQLTIDDRYLKAIKEIASMQENFHWGAEYCDSAKSKRRIQEDGC
jgi:hypothetical protein